jgi:orotate phosphoribosyltransferase
VRGRRGHFRLESGHHGGLWLDLDGLFARPAAVAPFVDRLAARVEGCSPDVVCGPLLGGAFLAQWIARDLGTDFCFTERRREPDSGGLYAATYRLPPVSRAGVAGRRVALVDDAVSAGSALRATQAELEAHGAEVVGVGALLVLGDAAPAHFGDRGLTLQGVVRDEYRLWQPAECPLCAAGSPLEDVGA